MKAILAVVTYTILGVWFTFAAWFGYGARLQAVGLYACRADLSECKRLVWKNSLTECRAARLRHATAPTERLVCVRHADFSE